MGIVGRWIDSLSDEERDRIVEAQDAGFGSQRGTARCIVEMAGYRAGAHMAGRIHDVEKLRAYAARMSAKLGYPPPIGLPFARQSVEAHFDLLCIRFGLARIVRLCKLRAGHVPEIPQPSGRAERTGPGAWPVTVNPKGGA